MASKSANNQDSEPKIQKKVKTNNEQQAFIILSDSDDNNNNADQQKQQQQQQQQNGGQSDIKTKQLQAKYKKDYHSQKCSACKKPESVIGCGKCQKAYHLKCIGIKSESEIPQKYLCEKCSQEKNKNNQAKEIDKKRKQQNKILEQQMQQFQLVHQMNIKQTKQIPLNAYFQPGYQIHHQQMMNAQMMQQMAPIQQVQNLMPQTKKLSKKDKQQEELNQKLREFGELYPQYMEGKKPKFPMDDMTLHLNADIFPSQQNKNPKPEFKSHPYIEDKYLSDILQIWNFFQTFSGTLNNIKLTIEQVYLALKWEQDDETEQLEILSKMHMELLNLYINDLFKKNKIENKDVQEQSFFMLLKLLSDNQDLQTLMPYIWTEIFKNLVYYPDFKIILQDQEIQEDLQKLAEGGHLNYHKLSFETKIKLLNALIFCVQETDTFRNLMQENQEQILELQKEKTDLINELKKFEIDLKIQRSEVKTAEQNFENKEVAAKLNQVSRIESIKINKEMDKERKELNKLQKALEKQEIENDKKKSRLEYLQQNLPFLLNNVVNLGRDLNKAQYWFFVNDDCKIYVQPNTHENQDMLFIDTKEDIEKLRKSCNKYGIREKFLLKQIDNLIENKHLFYSADIVSKSEKKNKKKGENGVEEEQEDIEIDLEKEDQIEDTKEYKIEQQKKENIEILLGFNSQKVNIPQKSTRGRSNVNKQQQQSEIKDISYATIKQMLIDTEKQYTSYLEQKNYRWETPENRKIWKLLLQEESLNLENIKKALHMLNNGTVMVHKLQIGVKDDAQSGEEDQVQQNNEEQQQENKENDIQTKKLKKKNQIIDEDDEEQENNQNNNDDEEEAQFMGISNKNSKDNNSKDQDKIEIEIEQNNENLDLYGYEENKQLQKLEESQNLKTKKVPLLIWGKMGDNYKQFWQDYQIDNDVSLFIATHILCRLINDYIEKKQLNQQVQNGGRSSGQKKETQQIINNNTVSYTTRKVAQKKLNYNEQSDGDDFEDYYDDEESEKQGKSEEEADIEEEDDFDNQDQDDEQDQDNSEDNQENSNSEDIDQGRTRRQLRNYKNIKNKSKNSNGQKKRLTKLRDYEESSFDDTEQTRTRSNRTQQQKGRGTRNKQNVNRWDDQCKKCKEFGDVICCDSCPSVYHLKCTKLKDVPEGNWTCMDCLNKIASQRSTRSSGRNNIY